MLLKGCQQRLAWLSCCLILVTFVWIFSLPVTYADNNDDDAPGLAIHYERLYKHYKSTAGKIKSDCKLVADREEADDPNHKHWGTMESLEFLSGNWGKDVSTAEGRMNLPKLRQYLARVGYLQVPGSLVFESKQSLSVRLTGCWEHSWWRRQGEKGKDKLFQEEGAHIGPQMTEVAPNAFNYIHKYTCYKTGIPRCSHTFYVITKMVPELPHRLLVREKESVAEFGFPCTVPFCQVKDCYHFGQEETPVPRRSYPPFKLLWVLPDSARKFLGSENPIISQEGYTSIKNAEKEKSLAIVWENKLRRHKADPIELATSYIHADQVNAYDWKDGFGENIKEKLDDKVHSLHSRILIKNADSSHHTGRYECLIEDANGVVSTPNVIKDEYRGEASVHVISSNLYISYGIALLCLAIVALVIFFCPAKLEDEDGNPYTEDGLVGVAEMEQQKVAVETVLGGDHVTLTESEDDLLENKAIKVEEDKSGTAEVTPELPKDKPEKPKVKPQIPKEKVVVKPKPTVKQEVVKPPKPVMVPEPIKPKVTVSAVPVVKPPEPKTIAPIKPFKTDEKLKGKLSTLAEKSGPSISTLKSKATEKLWAPKKTTQLVPPEVDASASKTTLKGKDKKKPGDEKPRWQLYGPASIGKLHPTT